MMRFTFRTGRSLPEEAARRVPLVALEKEHCSLRRDAVSPVAENFQDAASVASHNSTRRSERPIARQSRSARVRLRYDLDGSRMVCRLVLVFAVVATALAAADLTGKWTGTIERNGSRVPVYLTLSQQDGKLTVDGRGGGIGSGGGGGSRSALGDGAGSGGVVGPGQSIREGVYRVGGGVSAPAVLSRTDPEYTEQARAAKYQGTVLLYVEIDANGNAMNIKVQRSLGLGLDEKAVEAVKQWRFKPGQKDGKPVTVATTIEVNFRL